MGEPPSVAEFGLFVTYEGRSLRSAVFGVCNSVLAKSGLQMPDIAVFP